MLRVEVLTILLLVGLSTQIPFKFTLFDNTVPDISQKCQNELTKEASKVQTCVNTLGLQYAEKIQKDFPNIDALKKDVCALIKDEQNQCINIVKVLIVLILSSC